MMLLKFEQLHVLPVKKVPIFELVKIVQSLIKIVQDSYMLKRVCLFLVVFYLVIPN